MAKLETVIKEVIARGARRQAGFWSCHFDERSFGSGGR